AIVSGSPSPAATSSSDSTRPQYRAKPRATSGRSPRTGTITEIMGSFRDASIATMKLPMPAAVLAGGASRRMGKPKADLPYGAGTLLEHQVSRLADLFESVFVVAKEPPALNARSIRIVSDRTAERAAIHGLARALEEVEDRVFVVAVDLPVLGLPVARAIAEAALAGEEAAVVPEADGRLQPLAAAWRRRALPEVGRRIASGELSLIELARAIGARVFPEEAWRRLDPSGRSFSNVNTLEDYLAARERG